MTVQLWITSEVPVVLEKMYQYDSSFILSNQIKKSQNTFYLTTE